MKKAFGRFFSFSWIDVSRFLFIFAVLKVFMLLFQVVTAARIATVVFLIISGLICLGLADPKKKLLQRKKPRF
jgi:hypothetical protein